MLQKIISPVWLHTFAAFFLPVSFDVRKSVRWGALFIALLLPMTLAEASQQREVSKDYRKAAKHYRFKIKPDVVFPANMSGVPLPLRQQEKQLGRFFEALDDLGENFVRRSGLKSVMICKSLKLNGMACAGVARDDCMYLIEKASKKVVYHEMFHIFDPKRKNRDWQKLNHPQFRYRGIDFPDRPVREKDKRALQEHYSKVNKDFSADFVSFYAQSSEVEDRAETFAAMMFEGRKFYSRVQKSSVLFNKMLFIIRMTGRNKLLGKSFWEEKLGSWINDPPPRQQKR